VRYKIFRFIFSGHPPVNWSVCQLTSIAVSSWASSGQNIIGKVIGISDGDTITILDSNKKQHKIRLYGIDCPESGSKTFGDSAKKFTASLMARKMASVDLFDTDRYGRTVGVVTVDGVNVNRQIIHAGYAWQYRHYCKEKFCSVWLKVENQARVAGVGLWSDDKPVPPWEWRNATRNNSTGKSAVSKGAYHGNVKSHVFHRPSCRDYNCKNCVEMFPSREAAIVDGYLPCGRCKP